MIYEFTTRAGGRITYASVTGAQILHLIGKQPGPRGVIVVADLPAAIAALESAVERERTQPVAERKVVEPHAGDDDEDREREPPVSLAQRAFPMLDLLRFAARENVDVTWGL